MKDKLTKLVIFGLALSLLYFSNGVNILPLFKKELAVVNRSIVVKTLPKSEFNGWVSWWDEEKALESLNKNSQNLKTISPMWYQIDSSGRLTTIPHTKEAEIKSLRAKGLKIVPLITNEFDPRRTSLLLNNLELRDKFIEELVRLGVDSGYHGFDIDFEEVKPEDQTAFLEFIKLLSTNLHNEDLILTLSTHASTGEDSEREVVKGYDLEELSKYSDFIKVMAYDFHNQNSLPGAVTPIEQLEKVLGHTTLIIPSKKLILGLPTYGYDWELESSNPAEVVDFLQAQQRITKNQGSIQKDPESLSKVGIYNKDGKSHLIWFEDSETLTSFINKSRSYGVYQFSFWRIGSEDTTFWSNKF